MSENTKRKLLKAFNALSPEEKPSFKALILNLQQHPNLILFSKGQRVPGSSLKNILLNMNKADNLATMVHHIFTSSANSNPTDVAEPVHLEETDPEVINHISTSAKRIRQIKDKAHHKGANKITVFISKNPFNGTGLALSELPKNIKALRELHAQGVTMYCDPSFKNNKAMAHPSDLYAFAHAPATSGDAVIIQEVKNLLAAYKVDIEDLQQFARKRFEKRWGNLHIVNAYAIENSNFKRFLKDLDFMISLPVALH